MLLAFACADAWGQGLPSVNSSPNTVGSGARALGMGGAFIAVADDATAASWNPGGLTQLQEPEFSLVYSWSWGREEFSSGSHPELEGKYSVDFDSINYASLAWPLPWTIYGRNLVFSLNYQRQFDFDRALDFKFRDIVGLPFGNRVDVRHDIHYRQEGSLSTLSPAFGIELTNRIAVGVVWNIWDQSLVPGNEWKVRNEFRTLARINGRHRPWVTGRIDEDYKDFDADNFTFGVLWKPTERLSIGGVYNTGFSADVKYTQSFRSRGPDGSVPFYNFSFRSEKRRIEFPSSYGLGVAYRFPNDKLTLSLDVTRREWDKFTEIDRAGRRTSPVTGLSKDISKVDPTYTVRFGAEYVFFDETQPLRNVLPSLRAGVYYDPEPSGGRPNTIWTKQRGQRGSGRPEDYYGVTFGAGVLMWNRVNLDLAYEYRWGRDVRTDTFALYKTDADVDQHRLFASTVVYFGGPKQKRVIAE